MLVIRLFRVGKKNQPSFKIVVTDKSRSATKGRFVEEVGFYNPLTKEKVLKQERIKYWLSVGAKPSATLQNLLVSEKIIEGKKKPIYMKKIKKEETPAEVKAQAEKPVAETPAEKPVEEIKEEKPAVETPTEKKTEEVNEEVKEEKPAEQKPAEETPKTE